MSTLAMHTLLAVALLTAPETAPADNPSVPLPAFQAVAEALEILDHRERKWMFADAKDFPADLAFVRRRYTELRDAPPLCDAVRMPDAETISAAKHTNLIYRDWLYERQKLFSSELWIAEAIDETAALWTVWDLAADARSEHYYLASRRRAMMTLRERIGQMAYYGGFMPAPVPVRRFWRID